MLVRHSNSRGYADSCLWESMTGSWMMKVVCKCDKSIKLLYGTSWQGSWPTYLNFQEDNHATFGSKKNFAPSSLDGKEVREDIDSMKRLIKSNFTAHIWVTFHNILGLWQTLQFPKTCCLFPMHHIWQDQIVININFHRQNNALLQYQWYVTNMATTPIFYFRAGRILTLASGKRPKRTKNKTRKTPPPRRREQVPDAPSQSV